VTLRKALFIKSKKDSLLLFKYLMDIYVKKPDIVHIQYTPPICGPFLPLFVLLIKLFNKSKVIITSHEKPSVYLKYLNNQIFKKMFLLYERLSFKYCNKVLVHTTEHKNEIMRHHKLNNEKVEIITFPIARPEPLKKNKINNILKKYNIDLCSNSEYIIYLGTIRPNKGLEYLIDSIAKLNHRENRKVTLLIIGKASNKWISYLNKLKCDVKTYNIENNVKFLGFVPSNDIPYICYASKFAVLPYTEITQSETLHLLMAYKKPLIVTNVGGIGEIVRKYNIGQIIEKENSEQLAESILYLLNNKELLLEYIKNMNKVYNNASLGSVVKKHLKIYHETITNGIK
jgi:glycosyltransferase involved in cell wall biosynthesis